MTVCIPPGQLTSREREVLELVADGLTNQEIGRLLWVTEDTVKSHMLNLRAKFQARCRAHAVAVGFRAGLLQ